MDGRAEDVMENSNSPDKKNGGLQEYSKKRIPEDELDDVSGGTEGTEGNLPEHPCDSPICKGAIRQFNILRSGQEKCSFCNQTRRVVK